MFPPNFIAVERIGIDLEINSKKRLLEVLGQYLARVVPAVTPEEVFSRLLERERLGSTGLGLGVALPHARLRRADQAYAAFVRLTKGIDFDAIDGQPVDLAFALVVPEAATEAHLQLLAKLAALFGDETLREGLRSAPHADTVLKLLLHGESPAAGA